MGMKALKTACLAVLLLANISTGFCADPVTKPVDGKEAPKSVKVPYCAEEKSIEIPDGTKDAGCCPFLKSDGFNAMAACCNYIHRNDSPLGRGTAINFCITACQL